MNTGSALARFTITLSQAVTEPVQVDWFTSDGTAKAGVDYAANKGTVIFAPGETAKTVDILVYGRALGSEDRSFYVEMLPPTNAILGASIGECIITVDTSGSTPVTAIIVPTGPKGEKGDPGEDGVSPDPAEIAIEVAPLIDVGSTVLTAQGTEALAKPDQTTVKAVARRVAYAAGAKIATVTLADGDNLIASTDLSGDVLDMGWARIYPRIMRGSTMISPKWDIQSDGKLLIKSAIAGDLLYVCQYDFVSDGRISSNTRELWRRTLQDNDLDLVDGSFWDGATLTKSTDAIVDFANAKAYVWKGAFPKTVPVKSSPGTTGGIDSTHWESVGPRSVWDRLLKVFKTVADVQADTTIAVGETVQVLSYYSGVANSGGFWTKTAETAAANKSPTDLQRLAFSDAAGAVYTFQYDPINGVNLEQLGGRPYNAADLPGCDIAPLCLSLLNYKRTIPVNRLIINTPAREYYTSKGIPLYQWTTLRGPGKNSTQIRVGKNLWTEEEIPHSSMSGTTTWYSLETFHFAIVHPVDAFAFAVEVSGISFVTNAGEHTNHGAYVPYYSDCYIANVNHVGVDTAVKWVNGYSSVWFRHTATARTNTPSTAGSWSIRCAERSPGVGCGTSLKFINCGYTDFILGYDIKAVTYLHLDTNYTEGLLTEMVGTITECPNIVMTAHGIERLTSKRAEPLLKIIGGSGVINGLNAAYNVTANGNSFVSITGTGKWVLNGINGKYMTGASTTQFILTLDTVEAMIAPVTYPDTGGPYANQLGANTFMLGTGGNAATRIGNAAAANFNSKTDPVNTVNKWMGKQVYDRTTGGIMSAVGPLATDVWRDGAGTLKYTPV